MPTQYSDIPEGFALASTASPVPFDDLPEGFSVVEPEQPPAEKMGAEWMRRVRDANPSNRQVGLTGRALAEGVVDLAAPFADALGAGANRALSAAGSDARVGTNSSQAFSDLLTDVGVPETEGGVEGFVNTAGRFVTGLAAGGPLTRAVMARLGFPAPVPKAPPVAKAPGAATLQNAGVPLDASQRSGSRLASRIRSAVTDNPLTTGRQAAFTETQQRAYTRAILKSIGVESDEATQAVMAPAKARIGQVFEAVAKRSPAVFDDVMEGEVAGVIQQASRVLPENELKILQNNVDDILNAVDDSGRIAGDAFNRINTTLGKLSTRQNVGHYARDLQESLFGALERSSPADAATLQQARQQWRSLQIISSAIGKGTEKFISPLRLSNAVSSTRNRAMSVFGQGGDQSLVRLAEAGRQVLPDVLPNSGTVPRGMMQAPLRALTTYPLYRGAQSALLAQPQVAYPGIGIRNLLAPGAGVLAQNALAEQR